MIITKNGVKYSLRKNKVNKIKKLGLSCILI